MAVFQVKPAVKTTNLRRIKEGTKKDGNNVATFEPYGKTGQHIVITKDHKVEVVDKQPVYGGYKPGAANVQANIDMSKKFYLVTSIKGAGHPDLVPGVDLYVYAEDVVHVP